MAVMLFPAFLSLFVPVHADDQQDQRGCANLRITVLQLVGDWSKELLFAGRDMSSVGWLDANEANSAFKDVQLAVMCFDHAYEAVPKTHYLQAGQFSMTTRGSDPNDNQQRPGFLIRRAHQLSTARFIEACKPYDMTTTQFGMMFVLNARPNIDQVNLARLAFFDRSTNSMVVDMLANRGWIERRIDPQDRRRRLLSLTGLGTEVLDAVTPATEDVRHALLAGLEQSEQDFLMRCLDLINSALGDANF
jgi:DNA-binding MarR family transcriptional regulator